MDSIQGVSLPRSGHNLLVRHLQSYFGSSDVCTGSHRKLLPLFTRSRVERSASHFDQPNAFHYCEYYYSCRNRPCCNPGNKFQKSHDFELDLPIEPGRKYIVQTRNFQGLMISWFELRLVKGRETDTADGFRDFLNRNRHYVDGFKKKWVDSSTDMRLILDYDEYLLHPVECLSAVVGFFDPEHRMNGPALHRIVKDVQPAKDNQQFRFFDVLLDAVEV